MPGGLRNGSESSAKESLSTKEREMGTPGRQYAKGLSFRQQLHTDMVQQARDGSYDCGV